MGVGEFPENIGEFTFCFDKSALLVYLTCIDFRI